MMLGTRIEGLRKLDFLADFRSRSAASPLKGGCYTFQKLFYFPEYLGEICTVNVVFTADFKNVIIFLLRQIVFKISRTTTSSIKA